MNGELFIKLKSFFPFSDPFFTFLEDFSKQNVALFFRMALLQFFETYQVYYTMLLIAIEFIFTVSLK